MNSIHLSYTERAGAVDFGRFDLKRRRGLKGKQMHRLRVLVTEEHYQKLRSFAPERGAGAIVERMIERELRRQERKTSSAGRSG